MVSVTKLYIKIKFTDAIMAWLGNSRKSSTNLTDIILITVFSIFIVILLAQSNAIPRDGVHNILNAYIVINTAFLAILFAAITINPIFCEKKDENERILRAFTRITFLSGLGLLVNISCYYLSYIQSIPDVTIDFIFWLSSAITFLTICSMVLGIKDMLTFKKN